ncbi:MAG: hypothetical protein L6V79_05145 [Clostridium sp.]|nr:MAG: hypothetical protein L6V79_05145 [Clostridium sp.]
MFFSKRFFVQLGLSHVDGINDFRAVFQHAVGEPAVRRADIDAFQIFNVDIKLRYRLLKFISAKAFKLVTLKNFDIVVVRNVVRRLFQCNIIYVDFALFLSDFRQNFVIFKLNFFVK